MPTGPNGVVLPAISGVGDLLNPFNWQDQSGNVPPVQFNNIDPLVNFPNNGDGRFWWSVSASTAGAGVITFIGNPAYLQGSVSLTWQITDGASDSSVPQLQYSTNGGATFTTANLSDTLQMGLIQIALAGATGLQFQVVPFGGVPIADGTTWNVAISITRQDQPPVASWQAIGSGSNTEANGLDPYNYNPQVNDPLPYDNLQTLQQRMIVALGFSAQSANPPPGLLGFVTEKLQAAQNFLYRKHATLQLRHFFRYKLIPGQRFYSIYDNDEDVNANINATGFMLDPFKPIEWAGAQDVRNVWYPLYQGINPSLYTMLTKPWRPARFDIRQTAIEVWPVPDQTYWVWLKGHAGMTRFTQGTDIPNIDSELVFMFALGTAKAHYQQPDAGSVLAQAKDYLGELVAGGHGVRRYIPNALPTPPAIRPTLIQFDDTP